MLETVACKWILSKWQRGCWPKLQSCGIGVHSLLGSVSNTRCNAAWSLGKILKSGNLVVSNHIVLSRGGSAKRRVQWQIDVRENGLASGTFQAATWLLVTILCCPEGSAEGRVQWQIDVGESGLRVDTVQVQCPETIFHSGKMSLLLCSGDKCVTINQGRILLYSFQLKKVYDKCYAPNKLTSMFLIILILYAISFTHSVSNSI